MVKVKVKEVVGGRGRQGVEVKIIRDPKVTMQRKKTKGMLLQEMIKAAHDAPSDGFIPCDPVNSKGAGSCILTLLLP